jgi:peptide/nickel transport system ATP-binding protein
VTELLEIEDLHVTYRSPQGLVHAVDGAALSVSPGEVVAVVGESGSGKSTMVHSVLGLLPAGGRIESGRILFHGRDLVRFGEKAMRGVRGREIGFVPQDPMVSLNPVKRVGEQVAEVLRAHGLASRAGAANSAVDLLEQAGLTQPQVRARQYPHELSGGMRQRALIAIALAGRPDLIIADEPTSALDVTVQRRILDHLEQLAADRGTAVLLVTHDLAVAAERATRIAVMSGGRLVEQAAAAQIMNRPSHPYTQRLLAAAPSLASGRLGIPSTPGPVLLEADGLTKDFPLPRTSGGPRTVRAVDSASFTVLRGETFALVGESGSGKSTVARLVMGLERPTTGTVTFDGLDVATARGAALRGLRRRAQLVHQNPYASLNPRLPVRDVIAEPLRSFKVAGRADRAARVAELADQVALPASALDRRPAELSGGQRQRVAIARALALRPDLVVYDEPVSALDVSVQDQILRLIVRLQEELGLSYLFISHDLAVVGQIADRIGVMRQGRLVETGDRAHVLTRPDTEHARALLGAVTGPRREP